MTTKESTLNSSAYVLGLTKQTLVESLYKIFYNRITYSGIVIDTHSPARTKWIYTTFPLDKIDNSNAYPIIVLNSPDLEWVDYTYTKRKVPFIINVEIYSTNMAEIDPLTSQVINCIENSWTTLRNLEIRFVRLTGTSYDHAMRDKISVHTKTITFAGEVKIDKS